MNPPLPVTGGTGAKDDAMTGVLAQGSRGISTVALREPRSLSVRGGGEIGPFWVREFDLLVIKLVPLVVVFCKRRAMA